MGVLHKKVLSWAWVIFLRSRQQLDERATNTFYNPPNEIIDEHKPENT
jgi:hypothetical protein